jgi:hypothetical protein
MICRAHVAFRRRTGDGDRVEADVERSDDGTRVSRGLFYKGVALGATVSIVLLGAQAAFAGTGLGAMFNLGRTNTVGATSTLAAKTGSAALQVTNKSTGASATGVSITVDPRRAPIKVNSRVQVPNLNSSFLQGRQAADFLGVGATAANSLKLAGRPAGDYLLATATAANASKLGGKTAAEFLLATGTAADASKLGGKPASDYVSGCPLFGQFGDPATGGQVAARAIITGFSASSELSTAGVSGGWTCSGGPIWVERGGPGAYCVIVDPTATYESAGEVYAGLPLFSDRVAPLLTLNSVGLTATAQWTSCGASSGIPGQTQYLGYYVEVRSLSTGLNADAAFTFALV